MNNPREEDLVFCQDHVAELDPWYRLHWVFAPGSHQARVTATQALLVMLERSLGLSEESLVFAQLAWWQQELQPERSDKSAHPVIRALREGEISQLPSADTSDALIAALLERFHGEPLAEEDSLYGLCDRAGWPGVCAYLGIDTEHEVARALVGQCAGSGIVCLIDSALRASDRPWWFVPLSLQAKHQFDLNSIGQTGQGRAAVLGALLELANQWITEQNHFLGELKFSSSGKRLAARHLVAMNTAHALRLERTRQDLESKGGGNPGRWGVSDMVRVWSACRKFSKSNAGV